MRKKEKGCLSDKDIEFINAQYQKRINTGTTTKEKGVVVCLDVLGWKNYTRPNQIENLTALTAKLEFNIYASSLRDTESIKNCKVNIINLSDTIFIFISDSSPYFFINIFSALAEFVNKGLEYSFAFRGAISYGEYKYNKSRTIFTGDAIYEAATYCECTEWAGIIITDSLANVLLKNNKPNELERINLVEYKNIPYKESFFKKHSKCKDFLVLNPNEISFGQFGERIIDKNLSEKYKIYFSTENGNVPNELSKKLDNTIDFINFINTSSKNNKITTEKNN